LCRSNIPYPRLESKSLFTLTPSCGSVCRRTVQTALVRIELIGPSLMLCKIYLGRYGFLAAPHDAPGVEVEASENNV